MKIRRGTPFGRCLVSDGPYGTFQTARGQVATCDVSSYHSGTGGPGHVPYIAAPRDHSALVPTANLGTTSYAATSIRNVIWGANARFAPCCHGSFRNQTGHI
jgi:hypothetical protein